MAIENVQRNSTGVVKVTALDAIGNVLPEFSAAASDIAITDGTNSYSVSSASWSNGIGLLNVTTPNVTGVKTLTLTVKGQATTLYPSPFQINLVDPYAGRFNTTGGRVIWDMKLDAAGTQTQMVDFSGNGNTGSKYNASAFVTTGFTDTTVYVDGSGTNKTLGQYRFGGSINDFLGGFSLVKADREMCALVSDQIVLDTLTKDLDYSNNLPIRSINTVWWQEYHNPADDVTLFAYRFNKSGDTNNCRIGVMKLSTNVAVVVNGSTACAIPVADGRHLWDASNKIAFIGVTFSVTSGGDLTVVLYLNNQTATGTVNLGTGYNTAGREFCVGTSVTGNIGDLTPSGGTGDHYACLDFCAYGDEKNADFFRTNAAAWGL